MRWFTAWHQLPGCRRASQRHRLSGLRAAHGCGTWCAHRQSLGPFRIRRNRRHLAKLFSDSPLVLLRDARSRQHVLDLGVSDAPLHVVADAVFGRTGARPFEVRAGAPIRSVAVSVRDWPPGAGASDPAVLSFRRAVAETVT